MGRPSLRDLVLAAMPGTQHELVNKSGVSRTAVFRHVEALHAIGQVHIAGWVRTPQGGPFQAVYVAGAGVDVVCKLKPLTDAQKQKRFIARAKKDGRWDDRLARDRAKYWARRARTNPDPLVALFFGMGAARPAQR